MNCNKKFLCKMKCTDSDLDFTPRSTQQLPQIPLFSICFYWGQIKSIFYNTDVILTFKTLTGTALFIVAPNAADSTRIWRRVTRCNLWGAPWKATAVWQAGLYLYCSPAQMWIVQCFSTTASWTVFWKRYAIQRRCHLNSSNWQETWYTPWS